MAQQKIKITGRCHKCFKEVKIKIAGFLMILMGVNRNLLIHSNSLNPFSTNVPLTDKPGSWFLLARCLKNTCGRVTF